MLVAAGNVGASSAAPDARKRLAEPLAAPSAPGRRLLIERHRERVDNASRAGLSYKSRSGAPTHAIGGIWGIGDFFDRGRVASERSELSSRSGTRELRHLEDGRAQDGCRGDRETSLRSGDDLHRRQHQKAGQADLPLALASPMGDGRVERLPNAAPAGGQTFAREGKLFSRTREASGATCDVR